MPNNNGFVKMLTRLIDSHIRQVHTAFLGKVTALDDKGRATVQPLTMTKSTGEKAAKYPSLTGVPVIESAKPVGKNDVVLCVCCERDISDAIRGVSSVPANWHHSMTDTVVVGVIK